MTTVHPLPPEDVLPAAAMRRASAAYKGEKLGPEARSMFNAMFAATPAAADIRTEPATIGAIPGCWLRPNP
jgi:monoterpene epsilon-lactone hydrolase